MICNTCGCTGEVFIDNQLVKCPDCDFSKMKLSNDDIDRHENMLIALEQAQKVKRLKFHIAHMEAAFAYSKLSHCKRAKVGALLVSHDHRPLLSGYNGTSAGQNNCCEEEVVCPYCNGKGELMNDEYGSIPCSHCNGTKKVLVTSDHTHHAERNLLGYANKYGIATDNCSIYVTLQPCIECAKQMQIAGIIAVYYHDEYRDKSGVEYLKKLGVHVEQITLQK